MAQDRAAFFNTLRLSCWEWLPKIAVEQQKFVARLLGYRLQVSNALSPLLLHCCTFL